MVLYRKYRPQKLSEMIGQEHIKSALIGSLTSGKIAHAYLFAGPRGSGKTTTARILAKALNCQTTFGRNKFSEPCGKCESCQTVGDGTFIDLIEIDAASNRGIDDIRELREKIKLSPAGGRFKIYIIDEAHMLTNEAFNALLKTLEEPPAHAVFVLCTTSVEKLPITIVSRCNRFDFKKATIEELEKALSEIAKKEKLGIDKEAIFRIGQIADGSFRDALTILDQLGSLRKKITASDVDRLCAFAGIESVAKMVEYLALGKVAEAIILTNKVIAQGADLKRFLDELLAYFRAMLFIKSGLVETVENNYTIDIVRRLENQSGIWSREKISRALRLFTDAASLLKSAIIIQLPVELAIVDLVDWHQTSTGKPEEITIDEADDKIDQKEEPVHTEVKVDQTVSDDQLLNEKWPQFLKGIKKHNTSVESLLRLARPISFINDVLTLEVFYRFHKERIESIGVHKLIAIVGQEVFAVDIKVKCILGSRAVKTNVTEDLEVAVSEIFAN